MGKCDVKQYTLSVCAKHPLGVGPDRLCSATFEQLLAFGAAFSKFSNFEQLLVF